MAKIGDVIENPVSGEKMTFLQTAETTRGELLEIDMVVRPGGSATVDHVHPLQEERFIVKTGTLTLRVNGVEQELRAGEEALIMRGTPHVWWNGTGENISFLIEFRPAGRFAEFISSFFGLAQAGGTNGKGIRNPLQMAVMASEYADTIYLAKPPLAVQKVLLTPLALLARALGYKADVPYERRQPFGTNTAAGQGGRTQVAPSS